jgi:undecaprenyl phosphate N,N'-diacetylbacillosamine 1-phosphate transferase
MYKKYFKRVIDFSFSLVLIVISAPIILIITLIFLFNNCNPFFLQSRPGKNTKSFKLLKFKTMDDKKDIYGNLLPDEERITKFGQFIRKTSLDELPQLINVLKGDMSLIGPRPLLVEYLPLYNNVQKQRHKVKPGITGYAQVNGRNTISWKQKFEYDLWYIENISLSLDIKIAFLTIKKVFRSEGISSTTAATMEKFTGN